MRGLIATVLAIISVIALLGGIIYLENKKWEVPSYIQERRKQLEEALTQENLDRLKEGTIVNWEQNPRPSQLLYWVGVYLEYAQPYSQEPYYWANEQLGRLRARDDKSDPNTILEYGVGRCEEFSIVFAAFCKIAGYDVRIVWDYSVGISPDGKQNGDHVWVEVDWLPPYAKPIDISQWINDGQVFWCHIEPTDGAIWATTGTDLEKNPYINNPLMYERDRKKEVTDAWAVWLDYCLKVTDRYQYEE